MLQGRGFLVVAVYVASLVLVAFGHCAPTFGPALVAQAEHSHDAGHSHDAEHSHEHDSGGHHEHSESAEDCTADLVAKGCLSTRIVAGAPSADSVAFLVTTEVWRKAVPLITLTPERPPDPVPRVRPGYAQILARTGRLIV